MYGEHVFLPNNPQPLQGGCSSIQITEPLGEKNIHPQKESKDYLKGNQNTYWGSFCVTPVLQDSPAKQKLARRLPWAGHC